MKNRQGPIKVNFSRSESWEGSRPLFHCGCKTKLHGFCCHQFIRQYITVYLQCHCHPMVMVAGWAASRDIIIDTGICLLTSTWPWCLMLMCYCSWLHGTHHLISHLPGACSSKPLDQQMLIKLFYLWFFCCQSFCIGLWMCYIHANAIASSVCASAYAKVSFCLVKDTTVQLKNEYWEQ